MVVQDYTFGKYLGYLNITFDANGDVTSWAGNPILLDASVQPGTLLTVCNLASWLCARGVSVVASFITTDERLQ